MVLFAGLVLALIGLIILFMGLRQRSTAGLIGATPLLRVRAVAALGGGAPVALEGPIELGVFAQGGSGKRLIYAEMDVTAEWQKDDKRETKLLATKRTPGNFFVLDGADRVLVDTSQGVQDLIEKTNTIDERECMQLLENIDQASIFGGSGVANRLAAIPPGAQFIVKSRAFYEIERGYVCGIWDAERKQVSGAPNQPLIISPLSRDALLAQVAGSAARLTRIGGIGLAVGLATVGIAALLR